MNKWLDQRPPEVSSDQPFNDSVIITGVKQKYGQLGLLNKASNISQEEYFQLLQKRFHAWNKEFEC